MYMKSRKMFGCTFLPQAAGCSPRGRDVIEAEGARTIINKRKFCMWRVNANTHTLTHTYTVLGKDIQTLDEFLGQEKW